MKTVFLYLSTRLYASDALHTDYIRYLSEKYRVVVFFAEIQGGIRTDTSVYFQHPNVIYKTTSVPSGKFLTLFDVLLRNEFIRRFDDNPAVKWRNRHAAKDQRRRLLRRIARLLPARLFTSNFLSFLESRFAPNFALFKKHLEEFNPSVVLVSTPGLLLLDVYAIAHARRAKIPSIAFNFSWDNLTVYPRHIRHVDYMIVWSDELKRQAVELHGYDPEKIFVSGALRFDRYFRTDKNEDSREQFLKKKCLDPKLKTVFFASKCHGTFHKDFIGEFIARRNSGGFSQPLNLFVRIHPMDSFSEYAEFLGEPNVHIERPGKLIQDDASRGQKTEMDEEDFENMKLTLKYADVCVALASTMSVEAMAFDKPVINIGFVPEFSDITGFDHYRPIIEHHASRLAASMDDLWRILEEYLKDSGKDTENRAWAVKYMMGPTDGLAYKRNVDILESIIGL